MKNAITHVYISPHLDDAVCSCGGLIREQTARGERVLVVTLFTMGAQNEKTLPPYLRALHCLWGFSVEDPFIRRREEDRAALEMLGADYRHLGLQGALYRQAPDGHYLYPGLGFFGRPADEDLPLLAHIRRILLDLRSAYPEATFYAPLAVGGHVDHRLVNQAMLYVPGPTSYYEDIPYVLLGKVSPFVLWTLSLTARLGLRPRVLNMGYGGASVSLKLAAQGWSRFLGGPTLTLLFNRPSRLMQWRSVLHPIDLPAKFESMLQYTSQIPMMFGSSGRAWKALESYATSLQRGIRTTCERQWLLEPRPQTP